MGPDHLTRLNEWIIGFRDYGEPMWFTRWLKKGYQHCFGFTFDPESNVWIVIDPTFDGAYVRAFSPSQFAELLPIYRKKGATFLRVIAQNHAITRPRVMMTCASMASHMLGLQLSAVTPYQLYRYLLKIGAKPIFEA